MDTRRLRTLVLAALAAVLLSESARAATQYNVTDLKTLGGYESAAYAINEPGLVAGYAGGAWWSKHAATWTSGSPTDLGIPPDSEAYGVNDIGHVVGRSIDRGFILDGRGVRYLGGPGGSPLEVWDINNKGQVVGWMVAGSVQAFIWDETNGLVSMNSPGSPWALKAYAINDAGQAVGWASGDSAFLWDAAVGVRILPTLSGRSGAVASDINSLGDIAGYSDDSGVWRACVWDRNGELHNLGVLPGFRHSHACGINDLGQVVGYCTNDLSDEYDHGFIWTAETGMIDLKDLVLGWPRYLERARAINNRGQIVGHSAHANGHGFLLTPVPEPAAMLTLLCGLAGMLALRRKCV